MLASEKNKKVRLRGARARAAEAAEAAEAASSARLCGCCVVGCSKVQCVIKV